MTPRTRLTLAIFGLIAFIGLAVTMLVMGETVTAVSSLIPVIVLAVVHLLQAFDGRRGHTPPHASLRPVTEDTKDTPATEDTEDEERPAA
ncbi:hypothetical protein [Streptomyces tauricus]|uniref:hypothetical protein n=1 Tax=Streptomyces tauricus TaxID=68274 RepID=UPI003816A07E